MGALRGDPHRNPVQNPGPMSQMAPLRPNLLKKGMTLDQLRLWAWLAWVEPGPPSWLSKSYEIVKVGRSVKLCCRTSHLHWHASTDHSIAVNMPDAGLLEIASNRAFVGLDLQVYYLERIW